MKEKNTFISEDEKVIADSQEQFKAMKKDLVAGTSEQMELKGEGKGITFLDFVKQNYPNVKLHPYQMLMINAVMDGKTSRVKVRPQSKPKNLRIKELQKLMLKNGIKHNTINIISALDTQPKSIFHDRHLAKRNGTHHNWCIIDDPMKKELVAGTSEQIKSKEK